MDSYLQQLISRSDCEISRDCGKIANYVQLRLRLQFPLAKYPMLTLPFLYSGIFIHLSTILVFFFFQAIRFEVELRNVRSLI